MPSQWLAVVCAFLALAQTAEAQSCLQVMAVSKLFLYFSPLPCACVRDTRTTQRGNPPASCNILSFPVSLPPVPRACAHQ